MKESVLGPFKRMPGSTAAIQLTQTDSLLIFTVSCCGNSSSWHWCSRLESPVWGWDPLLLSGGLHSRDIPPDSQ